jgi:hypothetical protein
MPEQDDIFPEVCDSCSYEAKDLKSYSRPMGSKANLKEAKFCDACAGTLAGNVFWYPDHYDDNGVLRSVAYVTNMILDAIKATTNTPKV